MKLFASLLALSATVSSASEPECLSGKAAEKLLARWSPAELESQLPRELRPRPPGCVESDGTWLCTHFTRGLLPGEQHSSALIGLYEGTKDAVRLRHVCRVPAKYSRDEVVVSFLVQPSFPASDAPRLQLRYPSGWGTGMRVTETAILLWRPEQLELEARFPSSCRIRSAGREVDVRSELSPGEFTWSVAYRFEVKNAVRGLEASGRWTSLPGSQTQRPEPLIKLLNEDCETSFPF